MRGSAGPRGCGSTPARWTRPRPCRPTSAAASAAIGRRRAEPALVVDASNVIGARPDGWWRDRAGAARRLVAALDGFAARTGDAVTVVLDAGEPPPAERVEVVVAARRGRDAADDTIVALLAERGGEGVRVVT